MSETGTPARSQAPRWMQIALGLSLALNLAVVGMAAGSLVRLGGVDAMRSPPQNLVGALLHEMPSTDRRALRDLIRNQTERSGQRRDEAAAMVAALRAVPFQPAAMAARIETHTDRRAAVHAATMQGWLDRVSAMSDSARAAYADRLQRAARHPGKHHRPD